MKILNNGTVIRILLQHERQGYVNPSPVNGKIRIADQYNDVFFALDKMVGNQLAAKILDVSPDQIDEWIDSYFVPEPFTELIEKHTGYLSYSLQEPTAYIFDGLNYWPHIPTADQLKRKGSVTIFTEELR